MNNIRNNINNNNKSNNKSNNNNLDKFRSYELKKSILSMKNKYNIKKTDHTMYKNNNFQLSIINTSNSNNNKKINRLL